MINIKDKTILLTGASKGIGLALSKELNKENAKLILIGRTFQNKDLTNQTYIEADLTAQEGITKILGELKDKKVDILINMAAVGNKKSLEDLTLEDFYNTQLLNLMAPFLLIKAVLNNLKQSEIGLVLNIGSGAGAIPFSYRSSYCASKFGLRGLSLSLSEEFKGKRPQFCLITLGSTMTTFGGKTIEEQQKKVANGEAVFPVEWVAKKLVEVIKNENRVDEIVLFPGDEGFGVWKKQ